MRYDTEEALRKTLERASALRKRRSRRRELALSVGSGGCLCALLVLVYAPFSCPAGREAISWRGCWPLPRGCW